MDIENLRTATAGVGAEETFITAVAPGSIINRRVNKYYPTEEVFLLAIADAMKTEYKAIVDAAFLLQIDDPQFVTRYDMEDPLPNDLAKKILSKYTRQTDQESLDRAYRSD